MLAILRLLITLLLRKESELVLVCGGRRGVHFLFPRENINFCSKKELTLENFLLKTTCKTKICPFKVSN